MAEQKKLFLLDAMALIYRAFFALNRNPRVNSKGLNTSAILGFVNTLWEVLRKEQPTHIGVAFDLQGPTFRSEGFVEYKANRPAMPDEIRAAIPIIKTILEAFRIPVLSAEGYEADDVIGTLAKIAEKDGFQVFMMTPDKDFGQLVSENIFMFKPAKFGKPPEKMGIEEVCNKFGIERPEQVIDMLGMWGDSADNIPGIPGVGEVTARKLLKEFDSLENLLENVDDVKNPKLREKIRANADLAKECKMLATIILDTPVEYNVEDLKVKNPDERRLRELFTELEFRNLASRIFTELSLKRSEQNDLFSGFDNQPEIESPIKTLEKVPHDYKLISTNEEISLLADKMKSQKEICFDTETTGVDANNAELVGISFCWKKGEAFYIPISEIYFEACQQLKILEPIFSDKTNVLIGQNIKYDISMLRWYDIEVQAELFDTMIAHYLLQPEQRHNMDSLAEQYLSYSPVPIETLIGKKGKNQGSMRDAWKNFPEKVKDYACEDADITFQLKEIFAPLLVETDTKKLFDKIEMPLIPVLSSMEAEGVKIDEEVLKHFSTQLSDEIKQIEKTIFEYAGETFKISSPKQIGIILFEKLKVTDKPKLTKTKQYATGEEVLVKLLGKHPIIEKILEYRALAKLKSTYVDALPKLINPRDNRIHTSYNQAVAATGRLSSTNPNLQNIPIRTARGKEIRKTFIPRNKNFTLLAADYSQVELRVIAHLSGDKGMKEAFNNALDIHTATAAKVFDVPLDDVTSDQRRKAKTVNFGIIYGMSAFGLSERLGITRKEAAAIISQYFEKYQGVKEYMDKTIEFAKEHQYVETIMHRRRYLADINSKNGTVRNFSERNAINAPVQGSAADMIKIAMIRVFEEMQKRNMKSKMILQVHDELVFDAHIEELEELEILVEKEMVKAMPLEVPILVDIKSGKNWLEAH